MKTAETILAGRTAILFDYNGTLADDEALLEIAYDRALVTLGLAPLAEGEYWALLGKSDPDISATLLAARSAEVSVDGLLAAVSEFYLEAYRRDPRIGEATVAMVEKLHAEGVRMGVVTGTLRALIEPALVEAGIRHLLDPIVTIEDVSVGKPDPAGFLLGAELMGLAPEEILVFEDSRAGVAAAHAAGMTPRGVGAATGLDDAFTSMEQVATLVLGRES